MRKIFIIFSIIFILATIPLFVYIHNLVNNPNSSFTESEIVNTYC